MKNDIPVLRGPFTHENLSVFVLEGARVSGAKNYRVLQEALQHKEVLLHETGVVGQLEAENLSPDFDVFIQAGDVLKGGRQDRTIGVDFILPPSSGRVPVPAFCVESGRWHKRQVEDDRLFGSSVYSLHHKGARLAAKLQCDQGAVWSAVAESQEALSATIGKSVHSAESPSSYQLSVEHADLQARKASFEEALRGVVSTDDDGAVGYAFYVDGERNSVDRYSSPELFRKLWPKLLDVAILEALSSRGSKTETKASPTVSEAQAWLESATQGELRDERQVPPRVRVVTKVHLDDVVFETFDNATPSGAVHTSVVAR